MPGRRHEVPGRGLSVGIERDLGVGRLGVDVPNRIAGNVGTHQALDDAEQAFARPQVGDGRLHDPAQVDQERGAGIIVLQRRHPLVQALVGVLVGDPPGGVQTLGHLVDDAFDGLQHRLEFGLGEQVLDDQQAVIEIAPDIFITNRHFALLASAIGPIMVVMEGSSVYTERICTQATRSEGGS